SSKRLLVETDLDGAFSASDIVPEIGDYTLSSDSLSCSASYALDAAGTTKYACDGYELYEYVDSEWNLVSSSTDKSFTFNPDKNGYFKLRWKMSTASYKVEIKYPETLGTMEITNAERDGDFVAAGSSFTVSAIATTDAPFARWFGKVAENDVSNATITVVVDSPKTLIPYFKRKWFFNGSNAISDEYWTLKVKGSLNALYPQNGDAHSVASSLGTSEIDLSKGVEDGKIIGLGYKAFRLYNVDTVILPPGCEFIQYNAFDGSGVARIEPFLPSTITNIGRAAFYRALKLEGSLVLGGKIGKVDPLFIEGENDSEGLCERIKITNLVVRSSATCGLKNRMFFECASIKDVWFESFIPIHAAAFEGVASLNIRIHVPKGDADWNALLAEKMVAWEDCSSNDKTTYWKRFDATETSEPPLGKVELAKAGQWMWVVKWTPYKLGLSIIVM
ncbi:MAG: leucine-rich repeat protein, partial [Kiritimatiellae bacterium]|nr:leucine-rich repeat protein [Kiritimatiellia bacterium]